MAEQKYWLWLSCIDLVRPKVKYDLAQALGGAEGVFRAGREELQRVRRMSGIELDALCDKSMDAALQALLLCREKGVSIITLQDAAYPERLHEIADPPIALYVLGDLPPVDDMITAAVVGTRKASPHGIKMALKIGRELAQGGGIVVSGMAAGCDAAAIRGALDADGVTIGVLGTAIDRIYPMENKELFLRVRDRGALISEYPPQARTHDYSFRDRNRLITGLSQGVVVVESPLRSGTKNTARHAIEQSRDVYAVPGNPDAPNCAGCNKLIAEGAVPVQGGEEILAACRLQNGAFFHVSPPTHIKKEIDKPKDIVYIDLTDEQKKLPAAQQKVLAAVTRPGMCADEIIEGAGLTARETLAVLTMLQLGGYVTQDTGKRYSRKR